MKENSNNTRTGAERILDALESAPDEMILSSAPEQDGRSRFPLWARWTAAAAACAVIAGGAMAFMLTNRTQTGTLVAGENLPKITPEYETDGMGFEAFELYEASDYITSNPWREEQNITVLPVYRNTMPIDDMSSVPDMAGEQLLELMIQQEKAVAKALGLELKDNMIFTDEISDQAKQKFLDGVPEDQRSEVFQPYRVKARARKAAIYTYADLRTTVWYYHSEPTECPLKSNDLDKAQQAAEYIKAEYSELFAAVGITEPVAKIEGGNFNYNGERSSFSISFYDAGSTPEESLLNYSLYNVIFYSSEDGGLDGIHITCQDLSAELVGNYPLITVDEAAEQLKAGNYGSSVPIGEDEVLDEYDRVELMYRTHFREKYYMPYYKFYVNVSDDSDSTDDTDLDCYGIFYVPAVLPEYIEGMPTYNGEFN